MRLLLPFPTVIFLVSKDISDVNTLGAIMNGSDQTGLVPADVEHGQVPDLICIRECTAQFSERSETRMLDDPVP